MASVLDLYGIKEVADVTFYEVGTSIPVLYLDSLKVTTIEETASQASSKGGKGNSDLIIWDFGKEITLNIEDALFSMKSMALMHGAPLTSTTEVEQTNKFVASAAGASGIPGHLNTVNATYYDPETNSAVNAVNVVSGKTYLATWKKTLSGSEKNTIVISAASAAGASGIPGHLNTVNATYYDPETNSAVNAVNVVSGKTYLATWKKTLSGSEKNTIVISAKSFPGTYKVVGDTYARGTDGKDSFFQFVIPQAKMSAEKTITMQAEGDPSTFSMSLKVTRPDDGNMLKLIKY